jgi:hypothetical protein
MALSFFPYFETMVSGEGRIKFYYKKNYDPNNDCFRFKVDTSTKLSVPNISKD